MKILPILALAALSSCGMDPAFAQTPRPPASRPIEAAIAALPRPPLCDHLNLLPGCHVEVSDPSSPSGRATTTKPVELDIWQKITAAALPDLEYASAQAQAAGTPSAGVRKQCWDAIIVANKQANGSGVKDAAGAPLTKPTDAHLFVDVESLAEVLDNLAPNGPLWVACTGAAGLFRTTALTFINIAVTGAAGLAALAGT